MSGFTKTVVKEFEFDGDIVKAVLCRLKRKHIMALSKHSEAMAAGSMDNETAMEMMEDADPALKDCLKSLDGLKDANGEPISKETVLEEAYFMPLVSDILGALMEISFVTEEQEGN